MVTKKVEMQVYKVDIEASESDVVSESETERCKIKLDHLSPQEAQELQGILEE